MTASSELHMAVRRHERARRGAELSARRVLAAARKPGATLASGLLDLMARRYRAALRTARAAEVESRRAARRWTAEQLRARAQS